MMWQVTDKGTINGINAKFDMNYTFLKPASDKIIALNMKATNM